MKFRTLAKHIGMHKNGDVNLFYFLGVKPSVKCLWQECQAQFHLGPHQELGCFRMANLSKVWKPIMVCYGRCMAVLRCTTRRDASHAGPRSIMPMHHPQQTMSTREKVWKTIRVCSRWCMGMLGCTVCWPRFLINIGSQ